MADLERYRRAGIFPRILKKLLLIERAPLETGAPLSRELATFRKLVFGDRTWRIIWRPEPDGSGATVWVIGDRDDEECYQLARRRIESLDETAQRQTLAEVLMRVEQRRKARRALGPLPVVEELQRPADDV